MSVMYTLPPESFYTARDLATPRRVCHSPYTRGFEDACYGYVFYCAQMPGTREYGEYKRGHEDGMAARAEGRV